MSEEETKIVEEVKEEPKEKTAEEEVSEWVKEIKKLKAEKAGSKNFNNTHFCFKNNCE
jgi:hypothetical protein